MQLSSADVMVPLDVPKAMRDAYIENYLTITRGTGRLMLFAGDQKVEHLNDDFFGEGITRENNHPEHLFRIASQAKIGVFATQLGLIARYGADYRDVPYMVKLNSKTNVVKTSQAEALSQMLYDVQQVIEFRNESGLPIHGVGYTVYIGSEYEATMLYEAAQIVYEAHRYGLITVLWMYPRGKAVKDELDPHLIAGAAGVAACLGSDFAKVNYPKKAGLDPAEALKEATEAAGRTRMICAGGSSDAPEEFLRKLHDQIHISNAAGNATGRNIHQKPLSEAVKMCNAIYAVTVEDKSVDEAIRIYKEG
ncbi:MAG TPA: aldolase [Deltaproteobacteria bacterium]|nr:aldolase [Deltaproteobacteria bacterium]